MQRAADRFERTQPRSWKDYQFAAQEAEQVPDAWEVIGWAVLAFSAGALFVGFLGL